MLDWNGNGRIDPTDVGISIAARGLSGTSDENDPEVKRDKNMDDSVSAGEKAINLRAYLRKNFKR